MAGVIHIQWYATVLRQERFAAVVSEVAPLALRYGATQYAVHQSRDDRYKITPDGLVRVKAETGTATGMGRR